MLLTNKALNSVRTTINFKSLKSPLCESLRKDRMLKKLPGFCPKNSYIYVDIWILNSFFSMFGVFHHNNLINFVIYKCCSNFKTPFRFEISECRYHFLKASCHSAVYDIIIRHIYDLFQTCIFTRRTEEDILLVIYLFLRFFLESVEWGQIYEIFVDAVFDVLLIQRQSR